MIPENRLLNIYLPLLRAFLLNKLISQSDLIMLGLLGEKAIAAFGVPARVMIFDMIVAFSLAPIVSLLVAEEQDVLERKKIIINCISTSVIVSLVLTLIGLFFYPLFIDLTIKDLTIRNYSKFAIFFLTLAIPSRFTHFIGSMILHGAGAGKKLFFLDFFHLITNLLLNYFLMFVLKFEFYGCILSTFFCSLINCSLVISLIKKNINLNKVFSIPSWNFFKYLISKSAAEWLRLLVLQLSSITTIFVIGKNNSVLTAFAAAAEFSHFVFIPLLALMRAIAIVLSSFKGHNVAIILGRFKTKLLFIFTIYILISIGLVSYPWWLGAEFYRLSGESLSWWGIYIRFQGMGLSLSFINAIYRGILQSRKSFAIQTKLEFISKIVLYLPLLILGIKLKNPYLACSGIFLIELFDFLTLTFLIKPIFPKKIMLISRENLSLRN